MSLIERDVVFQGKDENGNTTMDFPITRLANVEDGADIKAEPGAGDYIPVMDGSDNGQMKKMPYSALEAKLMKPQLLVKTEVGATVTVTNGAKSYQQTSNGEPLAFGLDGFGTWSASATMGGVTGTAVSVSVDTVKVYSITASIYKAYGAEWDGTSTTQWIRTDDAAVFTDPVPYISGATRYGSPFDSIQPWAGMVKAERTGGTMVAIPKFWYKLTQSGAKMKIQISDGKRDGFHVSPAHMDRGDGKGERDIIYVGRYHCGETAYKSVSGQKPKVSVKRPAARTAIHNLGTNIWQADFAMRFTIWLLYIVEFADWDSQSKIGYGCGDSSAPGNMGYTDSMPYHTGTTQSTRTAYGLGTQYRNIEGLWDNVLDWCDGCYNNSSGLNIILDPSSFSDTEGGSCVGKPSSGSPSAFLVSSTSGFEMFYPTAKSGSATTYSCDTWRFDASQQCMYVGGHHSPSASYGLFYIGSAGPSNAFNFIGSRLQELP